MHVLTLRLAPDRELGDLQPIAMTYAADTPMIPIQLTAVATEPDLGVTAWILGDTRAVPVNYRHVQINEALVDWFYGGFNYEDVEWHLLRPPRDVRNGDRTQAPLPAVVCSYEGSLRRSSSSVERIVSNAS